MQQSSHLPPRPVHPLRGNGHKIDVLPVVNRGNAVPWFGIQHIHDSGLRRRHVPGRKCYPERLRFPERCIHSSFEPVRRKPQGDVDGRRDIDIACLVAVMLYQRVSQHVIRDAYLDVDRTQLR